MILHNDIQPIRIAIDYYDGAIEGFISSFKHIGAVYFKIISWDELEDHRLFFVAPIENEIFCEALANLERLGNSSRGSWLFSNRVTVESDISKLAIKCRNTSFDSCFFAYANHIDQKDIVLLEARLDLERRTFDAFHQTQSLDDWSELVDLRSIRDRH